MSYVGAALYAIGGLLLLTPALLPGPEVASLPVVIATGAIAISTTGFMLVAERRYVLPMAYYKTLTTLGAVIIGISTVAGGASYPAVYGTIFVFVTAYAFFYFPTRVAITDAVFSGLVYAVALAQLEVTAAWATWVAVIATAVVAGSIIGLLGQKDRHVAELEREQAVRLRELDDLKTTFLQAVSHELRTPLAALLGFSVTLKRHGEVLGAEQRHELLGRVEVNARKLDRLLSDLLNVDRLTRGVATLHRLPTDVSVLLTRVMDQLEISDRAVHLNAQPVTVAIDGPKVERIVENLVLNAVKHTPPNTSLWVSCEPSGDGVHLSVADDGPGVAPDARARLFQPFEQGPSSRDAASPGTGIGLALVAAFAELHGGRAWIDDRPGGGAAFHVFLPQGEEDPDLVWPATSNELSGRPVPRA